MRSLLIARRELHSAFNSPVAYIVIVAFLLFTSVWLFFLNQFYARDEASLRIYFEVIPGVFIFLIPAMTMRSWAEEKRQGTLEVLLSMPLEEADLVLGKFLGSLGLLFTMLVLSLPLPMSVAPLGAFDWGQVAGQYLGVALIGATGIALGTLVSALASSQIGSFIVTGCLLLALTIAGQVPGSVTLPDWGAALLVFLSFNRHYDSFSRGVIDSRDLLFFLLAILLFLFLNARALVARKSP